MEEGLGREDENGAALGLIERHEQCGHGELHRFAEADLVGKDETRPAESVTLQREAGEVFLMGPESLVPAIDRRLDRGSGGSLLDVDHFFPVGGLNHATRDDALHVLHDEGAARKIDGSGIVPKCVKFIGDPRDRLGAVVFPKQFVVQLPRGFAFVDAAKENRGGAVGAANEASFPVDQPESLVREHTDNEFAAGERFIERTVARNRAGRSFLRLARAPAPTECGLRSRSGREVLGIAVGVADDPNWACDARERLACDLE